MTWRNFADAPNQIVAEGWRNFLTEQGIPCRLYPGDVASFMGVTSTSVRLMTTEDSIEEARALLKELKPPKDDIFPRAE